MEVGAHVCTENGGLQAAPGAESKNTPRRSGEPPPIAGFRAASAATIEPLTLQIPPFTSTPRGAVGTAPNGRFDVLSGEQTLLNVTAPLNAERVEAAEGKGGGEEEGRGG